MEVSKLSPVNQAIVLSKQKTTEKVLPTENKNGKKLLALSATTLATIGVATILIAKRKKINSTIKFTQEHEKLFQELLNKEEIDKKHLDFFRDIYSKPKNERTPEFFYKKLLEFLNFEKAQPELIKDKKICPGMMFYDYINGTITINPKAWSIGGLRHELVHAEQAILMYKAFGKEKLCEAYADCYIFNMKNAGKLQEKTEQEIQGIKASKLKEYLKEFNEEYYKRAIADSKELTPEEYSRAEKCLENARCYNGHSNGIIEKEAYSVGLKFDNMLRKFRKVLNIDL